MKRAKESDFEWRPGLQWQRGPTTSGDTGMNGRYGRCDVTKKMKVRKDERKRKRRMDYEGDDGTKRHNCGGCTQVCDGTEG